MINKFRKIKVYFVISESLNSNKRQKLLQKLFVWEKGIFIIRGFCLFWGIAKSLFVLNLSALFCSQAIKLMLGSSMICSIQKTWTAPNDFNSTTAMNVWNKIKYHWTKCLVIIVIAQKKRAKQWKKE
jgi:hypothetical protein